MATLRPNPKELNAIAERVLTSKQKDALSLWLAGYSQRAVARSLDLSLGATRARIEAGLRNIERELRK